MALDRRAALHFVLLAGLISLLADITYEGARSINGPFLAALGAGAALVGFAAGFGEFIGYALRLVSGAWCDRVKRYWPFVISGYAINLLAVPLLAWAGSWQIAVVLIICERLGKAIRNPARDAMLASAAERLGRGWGFGLHEAMDQIGAVTGPLIVAWAVVRGGGYRAGYAMLWIPALAALAVLAAAAVRYPNPHDLSLKRQLVETHGLGRRYWLYVGGAALIAAGYLDFPILAFHLGRRGGFAPESIPLLYALAMGTDAAAALIAGRWFDRKGAEVLVAGLLAGVPAAPLVLLGSTPAVLLGVSLWGVGLGIQESVLRAALAGLAPAANRGVAYGTFGAAFGAAWFAGSAALGALSGWSLVWAAVISAAVQMAALPLVWRALRT